MSKSNDEKLSPNLRQTSKTQFLKLLNYAIQPFPPKEVQKKEHQKNDNYNEKQTHQRKTGDASD